MKAMVYTQYGPPDVMQSRELDIPVPKGNEVLIRLHAVSLNASDWEILTGTPLYARVFGLFKPRIRILGSDIAGRVEAIGDQVTRFRWGDAVFGDIFEHFGGLAEYVCVPETLLSPKPKGLSYMQAAALPQSACIALQGIRDKGQVQTGQQVLINGAGGGSGSFAIQLAKHFGAEVTAVDNREKLEAMQAMGADHVIDYTREDFTQSKERYDLILDLAGYHSVFDYVRALKSGGKYFIVGGGMKTVLQIPLLGPLISLFTGKKMAFLVLKTNQDLDDIVSLVESGRITPVIDKVFPLDQAAAALRYLGEGHAKGKVVITMENNEK